jgi:hypothetical protein
MFHAAAEHLCGCANPKVPARTNPRFPRPFASDVCRRGAQLVSADLNEPGYVSELGLWVARHLEVPFSGRQRLCKLCGA